jgi:hypothetical protein
MDLRLLKFLGWGAVAWFVVTGLVLLQIAPYFPKSTLEWVLLIVVGPPLYVLGEALGAWLFSPERGHRISPKGFSFLRIAYALLIVLLFVMLGGTVSSMLKGGA